MAKRKKTKTKTKRVPLGFGLAKKSKTFHLPSLSIVAKVLAAVCIVAGALLAFELLEKYVKNNTATSPGIATLELLDPPNWITEQLKEKIFIAATSGGKDIKLDENTSQSIQKKIQQQVAWLDKPQVQLTHDAVLITGRWRKPLALVKSGLSRACYVDAEMVVLDFLPMPELPVVKVTGLSAAAATKPTPGQAWQRDDLAAAIEILSSLDRRDTMNTSERPLLREIGRIDVSNFHGRENRTAPHIILYTSDNTEIIWGAELGKWQQHLEATDEEKIAKLYGYYEQYGTLLGGAKYININLRDPQQTIPLPVDKY